MQPFFYAHKGGRESPAKEIALFKADFLYYIVLKEKCDLCFFGFRALEDDSRALRLFYYHNAVEKSS